MPEIMLIVVGVLLVSYTNIIYTNFVFNAVNRTKAVLFTMAILPILGAVLIALGLAWL